MFARIDDNVISMSNSGGLNAEVSNPDESSIQSWTTQAGLYSSFLPYVDPRELHRRISAFRMLNFGSLSYDDVLSAINRVVMFDTEQDPMSVLAPTVALFPTGTNFYRVRVIPENDHLLPLKSMSKIGDCWEPPPEVVPIGRLNREQEPLLYTSTSMRIAIEEINIPDGERFSLIVYEAVEDIKVAMIGGQPNTQYLQDGDALKVEMLQGFLRDEFTRDVGRETEYLYRISEIIAKTYFDLPAAVQDAWCYPSMADKNGFNVAFRPEKRAVLRMTGVQIAKVYRKAGDKHLLAVDIVAEKCEGSDDLTYFRIGSPEQQRIFPYIKADEKQAISSITTTITRPSL